MTFSQSSAADGGGASFTGYVGPSFRYMGAETTTDIVVRPDVYVGDLEFPALGIYTIENIDTYYAGGVIGGQIDFDVWSGASLSLGVGGGAYYASSHYRSETEAVLTGGTTAVNESIVSNLNLNPVDGFAYTLNANSTFSADIGKNLQLNFGIGAEYMSRVATSRFVGSDGVTSTDVLGDTPTGATDVSYDGNAPTGGTVLAFGDAWSFKATTGLTGRF